VEAMSTDQAVATFNVLSQEDRPVAVALLSRKPVTPKMASAYTRGGAGFDPDQYKLRSASRAGAAAEAAALLSGGGGMEGPPGQQAGPGGRRGGVIQEGGLFGGGTYGADGGDSIRDWLGMDSSDPRAAGVGAGGESATNLDGLVKKKSGRGGGDGHSSSTDARGRVRGETTPSRKRRLMALKGSPPRFYANRGTGGYRKPDEGGAAGSGQDWEKKGD